jgi:hypothetical protein
MKYVNTATINFMLRRAHCAGASILTGGGVVGDDNKDFHAAASSVVPILLLGRAQK